MFLKNYTSDVPASVTIQRIVALLVKIGVANISMDYAPDGTILGVTFAANIAGRIQPIKVPVDTVAAWDALWLDYVDGERLTADGTALAWSPRKKKRKADFKAQAERTAWRLMQDWLEVQISMVQLKQAEVLQVFLPYAWDGKQSYYAALKTRGFAALMGPTEEKP